MRETVAGKPWRADFFAAFVNHINAQFEKPISVLEIGSGPGFLAEAILAGCAVESYTLLDFSTAMHDLARKQLASSLGRVTFLQKDFKSPEWDADMEPFDVVVSMQAVHELRHWRHVPVLYWQIHDVLWDGGLFLVCDQYADGPTGKNPDLFMTRADQERVLGGAGFDRVELLLDKGEMTLLSARKWE